MRETALVFARHFDPDIVMFSCKPKSDCKVPCFAIHLYPHHILQSHFILSVRAHHSPNNNTYPKPPSTNHLLLCFHLEPQPPLPLQNDSSSSVPFSSELNWTTSSAFISNPNLHSHSQMTPAATKQWLLQDNLNSVLHIIYKPQAQNPADSGSERTKQSCYRSLLPQKVSHKYITCSQCCFNCFSIKWMVI